MPNTAGQSTDRSRRGALFILVLVAVIAAGLWYVLERPGTTESAGDAAPATGDSRAAGSGAAPERDSARTAGSDPATRIEESGTADAGTAPPGGEPGTADSETRASTDMARTTGPEVSAPSESVRSAGTDTTDVPQPADSDTTGDALRTAGAGPEADGGREELVPAPVPPATVEKTPVDAPSAADSDTTGDALRIAGAGPEADGGRKELVLAPAPATTIEKTPVDAPHAADTAAETEMPGAVERAIERMETFVQERLATGSEPDSDPQLRISVTYDDSQEDATQPGAEPAQTTRPADAGGTASAGPAPSPGSGVEFPADLAQSAVSDGTAPPDADRTADAPQPTDSETTGDALRIAAAGPEADSGRKELVLAPVPPATVEKTPVDAPPAADTAAETGVPGAVERAIERMETFIRERLATGSEPDSDPQMRIRVTYDDSQEDATQPGAEPAQTTRPADAGGTTSAGPAPSPGSGVEIPADLAESTVSDGTAPPDADRTADDDATEIEAKKYVETLTDTAPQTIPVDKADHFVTRERVISLVPEDAIENVSVGALARDETLTSDTPVTVVREVEQIEDLVPEQLIAESGGDLDKPLRVRVTYDDSQGDNEREDSQPGAAGQSDVERITVREALERIATEPKEPLSIIRTVRYFEVMTLKELLDREQGDDTLLRVVTRPYRLESATLADLLQRQQTENPDSIFYLHTVQPTDDQGIWGIVHFGLIDNFARGMAIRRGEDVETYTVRIPRDADERLDDRSSSFLGKLIDRKTKDSVVYNYRDHRIGSNPDRIYPGQEIVIVRFDPDELMAIYTHFAAG